MLERQKYEFLRSELKKARIEAEILQSDLAKTLKKPQSYISKIESGERGMDVIEFIGYCRGIGLDPAKWLKKFLAKV
jgi:transcriptional regulator with XRE-family HTH domain